MLAKTTLKTIDINEGRTGALALPAIGVCLVAIISIFIFWPFAILMFPVSMILFLASTGIELNKINSKYRAYYGFFGFKVGKWIALPKHEETVLVLSIDQYSVTRWMPAEANDRSSATEKTITYDIVLQSGTRKELLFQFFKNKHARKTLIEISSLCSTYARDLVQEKMANRMSRRL